MEAIADMLYGSIDMSESEFECGGINCKNYMSLKFKLIATVLFSLIYIYFIKRNFSNLQINEDTIQNPSFIEKIFGWSCIAVAIYTFYLKIFISKAGIYMINHCHILNLLQASCLLKRNTKTMKIINIITSNALFCGWTAIFFPSITGLTPMELFLFYLEHFQIALINPIIIFIFGRYNDDKTFSFNNQIFSYCFFGIYQRLVLYPISEITWINLNFSLCVNLSKYVNY